MMVPRRVPALATLIAIGWVTAIPLPASQGGDLGPLFLDPRRLRVRSQAREPAVRRGAARVQIRLLLQQLRRGVGTEIDLPLRKQLDQAAGAAPLKGGESRG